MKLALLGCDDEALALLSEVVGQGEHALVAAFDTAEFRSQVQQLAPAARLDEDWESLLLGNLADVVVVARGRLDPSRSTGFAADERRNDQLRKLVQAAVPLIVFQPGCDAIVGFELEMIRQDTGGIIVPFVPGASPASGLPILALFGGQSPIGSIEQVLIEREMTNRSRANVLAQLARDVGLARLLLGDLCKMSATAGAVGESADPLGPKNRNLPSLENLSVHLSGEAPFAARWTLMPAEQGDQIRISAIGSAGRAVLSFGSGLDPAAELKVSLSGQSPEVTNFEPYNAFEYVLKTVEDQRNGDPLQAFSWFAACRDVEVASSVDRSLERGRAVEFFGEEHSEEQSFKGIMAVGGCLMLSVTVVALLVAATVEGLQLPFRESPLWRAWPLYVLVPIVLFLLLQLLQGVARRPPKSAQVEQGQPNLPAG